MLQEGFRLQSNILLHAAGRISFTVEHPPARILHHWHALPLPCLLHRDQPPRLRCWIRTPQPDRTKRGQWPLGQNIPPPTRYEPNVTDTSDGFEVIPSLFQGSNLKTVYDLSNNDAESPDAELLDEHIRHAFASPLFSQETEAEASLKQTYHSNEEGLFKGAQSILASTGQPVVWLTQKRKSSQELDDDQIRVILEAQKEQLLVEAKSEILSSKRILPKKHSCIE